MIDRPKPNRDYELAWGVRIEKAPEDMNREELIAALDQVGGFASRKLNEVMILRTVIKESMKRDSTNEDY